MEKINSSSSMINSIGYDKEEEILEVEFKNNVVWQYSPIPKELWHGFKLAASQGKFFHKHIRGKFTENKIG